MAADQRKKRVSSASALGYGFEQGQYSAKKRDLRLINRSNDCDSFNSHILLKWNDNGKGVVAKDEQVGISWRHLSPFVVAPTLPPCSANPKLADVVCVPREIFELDDLTHVLSHEVWQFVLTENERNYLLQFLPRGLEPDLVVQALFSGDNFHFGNPCQKWGASLCSGDVHPDSIIGREKSFKAIKNENYFELQQYHDNMIMNLQKLKEKCASSKDPDAEILQMMSRSRRYAEKSNSLDANGYKSRKLEENALAISESPSTADDKSYYSDNQKLSAIRDLEIQRRIRSEEAMKDRHEKLATRADGVKISPKLIKGEKLQKVNVNPNDGGKYMSYVKISKKQHELVKSMKQSGSSIQSKTLNRVLGNLDSFNVKPYEMFVEEEQKRIQEFWSNLSNKDIPAALHYWRNMQSEKRQIMDSLLHEMEEKQNLVMEDDKVVDFGMHLHLQDENMSNSHDHEAADSLDTDEESSHKTSESQQNDIVSEDSISDDDKESNPSSMQNRSPLPSSPSGVNEGFESPPLEIQRPLDKAPLDVTKESDISPTHNQSSRSSPSLNVKQEINPMDLNAETSNIKLETTDFCSTLTEHLTAAQTSEGCHNVPQPGRDHPISAVSPLEMPCSPAKNVWALIGSPESYRSIPTAQYASSSEPSVRHQLSLDKGPLNDSTESDISPTNFLSSGGSPPFNVNKEVNAMDLNAETNNVTLETSDFCSTLTERHAASQTSQGGHNVPQRGSDHPISAASPLEMPICSPAKNVWGSIGLPESYHSIPTAQYASSSEPSVRHPQVFPGQPVVLIDLESDLSEADATKDLLNKHPNHLPFFNPYPRDKCELLQSLIKNDNHRHEQKKTGLEFNPATDVILESSLFPGHVREQLQSSYGLDNRHKSQNQQLFINPNIHDSLYPDNRYPVQGAGHFSTSNSKAWSNDRVPTPVQAPQFSSGELLNHNWFGSENRTHGGWSSSDASFAPHSNLGSGSGEDQSLFSVLSQCKSLRSQAPYNPVGSTDMLISPTNYGQDMAGGMSMTNNVLPQMASPFDYLAGTEAAATLKNTNLSWMSLGQQQSSHLHDPSGNHT